MHSEREGDGRSAVVLTVLSGHSGRPSGAQSGLPSNCPAVLVRSMDGPIPLEFRMNTSPLLPKPSANAILVPSGDQVQL